MFNPPRGNAALMAAAPSLGLGKPVNWPRKAPMGVRLAAAMTMSDMAGLRERRIVCDKPPLKRFQLE
jgi:hypothetical protein